MPGTIRDQYQNMKWLLQKEQADLAASRARLRKLNVRHKDIKARMNLSLRTLKHQKARYAELQRELQRGVTDRAEAQNMAMRARGFREIIENHNRFVRDWRKELREDVMLNQYREKNFIKATLRNLKKVKKAVAVLEDKMRAAQ